jgi:GTP-binding protein EngB required for normal cell division
LGETIDDLSRLETANPALKRIGFIGPSRVGKSTLLRTLQAQIPDGVVTDEPYAVVVLLQTTPVTYFGLIDAAGQAYAQQFKVFNAADKVIILLDHAEPDDTVRISKYRLGVHTKFLVQLQANIKLSYKGVTAVHFLLNKSDLWEKSMDKKVLVDWFDDTVRHWKLQTNAQVTSSVHSNLRAADVNSLVRFLSEWAK